MNFRIDSVHERILSFLREHKETELTLMDIGEAVWLDHSQKVINKLVQLEKAGYVRKNWGSKTYDVLDEPIRDIIRLPLYGSVQCGNYGPAVVEEEPIDEIWFNTTIFWISDPASYILVRAQGDSMEPEIRAWDILLVFLQKDYPEGHSIFLVHEGIPKIKRVHEIGGKVFLVSNNKKHSNLEILSTDEVQIIGTVKTKITAY